MIRLEHILTPGRSQVNVPGGSKKRVLEQIANLVARDIPGLDAHDIFESLVAREKLGSTGFGNVSPFPTAAWPDVRFRSAPCCAWMRRSTSTPSTARR